MINRYTLRDAVAGNPFENFDALSQAVSQLVAHEMEDKNDGNYTHGFYEIYDNKKEEIINIVDHQ
jgi:hypothetical protein